MLNVQIKKQLSHFLLEFELKVVDEIVVLFGASGSGKTTILNNIAGLENPDSGVIQLNGQIFYSKDGGALPPRKRNIGYLFQDYALFPHMTVGKNIKYGIKKNGEKDSANLISQLLEVLGISHLLKKYPHQISGGEKQRVALARALASEPSLLLLDEPLSALDEKTRIECQDELLRLHQIWKIPFIVVTHDRKEAEKLGDRVLFLERGRVVEASQNRRGHPLNHK